MRNKLTLRKAKPYISLLAIAILQCIQMQVSSVKVASIVMFGNPRVYASIGIIMFFLLLLALFKKKWPLYAGCVFATVFSIANYYTFMYHSGPLYFSTMKSAGTAFDVIGGYNFKPDGYVLFLAALLGLQILLLIGINFKPSVKIISDLGIILAVLVFCILQTNPYISNPQYCISHEGFPIAFIRDLTQPRKVQKPDFYVAYEENRQVEGSETPDIILILDESYSTLHTESGLKNLDNAVTGKVVVSKVGGGTNNSEFELLTSQSMKILPEDAPFNYLKEEALEANTVNHLKSLGYETTAMHCMMPQNYNRHVAYGYMGFDNIYLGDEYFTENSYGNRPWLDSDNFTDLVRLVKFEGKPQFVYMLTYQNHGGYEQNDDSLDTVHETSFGALSDDINEFLTGVKMTEDAFLGLIENFKKSGRPTIVCMVGDHNPPFVSKIESDEVKQKEVNYVIWANYDIGFEDGTMTMTDVLPVIFRSAGIEMSDFLGTAYEIHKTYPVHPQDDTLIDKDGNVSAYDGTQDILNEYYSKEYDRLTGNGREK